MRHGFDDPSETSLPFIVNVVNQGQGESGAAICNLCKQVDCQNCPFPVRHDLTLREFLTYVCDKNTFFANQGLYKSFKPPVQDEELKGEETNTI